jgi:hypothetical protein
MRRGQRRRKENRGGGGEGGIDDAEGYCTVLYCTVWDDFMCSVRQNLDDHFYLYFYLIFFQ